MKRILPFLAISVCATGCISIPMGKEEFTTEFPTVVRATWDSPTKEYDVAPEVAPGADAEGRENGVAAVSLSSVVVSTQPQEQHYDRVTLEKRKRLAFGLFPGAAEPFYRPKTAMEPVGPMYYIGDGNYRTSPTPSTQGAGALGAGAFFGFYCLLATPVALLYEPFGPYEHDDHFLGRYQNTTFSPRLNSHHYSKEDVDLLLKFSPADRAKIGAWTFHENASHPHNTFWNGFRRMAWVGFDKHCYYLMHDPVKNVRKEPVDPKVTRNEDKVPGPWTATLRLPDEGYEQSVDVGPDANAAVFRLPASRFGRATASGTLRILPPSGGLEAVRGEDKRELLRRASAREWPVSVILPSTAATAAVPFADPAAPLPAPATAAEASPVPDAPSYRIAAVERPASGGLVVRVAIDDASRTFDVDRAVQPDIRRLFRDQFASGPDDTRRESLRWVTEDDGKTLVYTVVFE